MIIFGKILIKILSLFFGALLLIFTATETYGFLLDVTGIPLIAAVGLVMFEGGFLYWALEFKQNAEGLIQMAIALLASLVDFGAVLAAVALRLGAFDQDVLGPSTGPKIVVAAVLVNLAAKYAYELAHPENTKNIYKRASEGLILLRTFSAFSQKTDDIAEGLADEMAVSWADDLRRELTFRHKALTHSQAAALPAPKGTQDVIQNGKPVAAKSRGGLFSFLGLGGQPKSNGVEKNGHSGHNGVARHDADGHPAPAVRSASPTLSERKNWTVDDVRRAVATHVSLREDIDNLAVYEEMIRQTGVHTRGLIGVRNTAFVPMRDRLRRELNVPDEELLSFNAAAQAFLDPGVNVEWELYQRLTDPDGRPLPLVEWRGPNMTGSDVRPT
jgi:hypothetical protein